MPGFFVQIIRILSPGVKIAVCQLTLAPTDQLSRQNESEVMQRVIFILAMHVTHLYALSTVSPKNEHNTVMAWLNCPNILSLSNFFLNETNKHG
jgi:hypothetical protein